MTKLLWKKSLLIIKLATMVIREAARIHFAGETLIVLCPKFWNWNFTRNRKIVLKKLPLIFVSCASTLFPRYLIPLWGFESKYNDEFKNPYSQSLWIVLTYIKRSFILSKGSCYPRNPHNGDRLLQMNSYLWFNKCCLLWNILLYTL